MEMMLTKLDTIFDGLKAKIFTRKQAYQIWDISIYIPLIYINEGPSF